MIIHLIHVEQIVFFTSKCPTILIYDRIEQNGAHDYKLYIFIEKTIESRQFTVIYEEIVWSSDDSNDDIQWTLQLHTQSISVVDIASGHLYTVTRAILNQFM